MKPCVEPARSSSAFVLRELIVLLAVLVLVLSVHGPSLARTRDRAVEARCIYNHGQLIRGWQLYADEHDGRVVGNMSGTVSLSNSNKIWVLGWLDFSGGLPSGANTNTDFLSVYSPLAPYLGRKAAVFKCPADASLSQGTTGLPRVRSYSMNSYVGWPNPDGWTAKYKAYKKISDFATLPPGQAMVFIDEREDSINDGAFLVDMTGYSPYQPGAYVLVDFPADWHNHAANLSFADGHGETWRWRDRRTMPPHRPGLFIAIGAGSANNPDVARIQSVSSRRVY